MLAYCSRSAAISIKSGSVALSCAARTLASARVMTVRRIARSVTPRGGGSYFAEPFLRRQTWPRDAVSLRHRELASSGH